jgi:fluoride exporter
VSASAVVVTALAGGAGCALRVLARDAFLRRGREARWAICAINLSGSLAMGAVAGVASSRGAEGSFVATTAFGMLAGWTTYSAFCMDVVLLWITGRHVRALALWAVTLAGSASLAALGGWLVRTVTGGPA